ncbi:vacuolar amino acid permease [Fomitiporia mediterranea MF3/22]|uniref:vacuolar amino acid permease n=1 Tax=Fomitiporia mediterranea (strain MF3/22) TaxID=694068 RepID=UPI00044080CE|nr:vacuolar amino acid permease [Fomitiporia mediterranea MF3/22]EJD01043.1 vacuolar amino acid permease [Fomitiporia mediterranea MF3/22]
MDAQEGVNSRDERTPLLIQTRPPSCYSVSHDSRSETSTQCSSPVEPAPLNKVSKADLVWVLLGLWSAVFLGALDGTIVATLLTPIGSSFNKSNQASYIGTSYLLSVCCFTPLYGRLSDILGRKGAMLLALSLFGSGTIFCGLAPSMEALIAARAVAGMGGGGVMTVSSVAVTDLIPLKQRGLYQGMANMYSFSGAGLGGPLGGWLNDSFGWRSAFLVQIPILALSTILVITKVDIKLPPEVQNRTTYEKVRRIDFLGSVTLVGTVGTLLLGFSLKSTEEIPWSHPLIWGLFVISAICGVAFVYVETHIAPFPVMPMHLITRRTPLFVSLSNLYVPVLHALFIKPAHIRIASGYFSAVRMTSSKDAGLHLLPHSVAISTGSVFAGWIMRKTGKLYFLTLTSAAAAVTATVSICFWNSNTSTWHLWFDIFPQGFGMASLITTTLIAMIAGVSKEDLAVATGITYLFRTTGQVIGVSLSGAVLQAVLLKALQEKITVPNAGINLRSLMLLFADRHSTEVIPSLEPSLQKAAIDSYARALNVVFICQAAMNFLAFLCTLPIQENPLPYVRVFQRLNFFSPSCTC